MLETTGFGDATYNTRRNILGAIPITGKIAYHMFQIDTYASNRDAVARLCRKPKWYEQQKYSRGN